MTSVPVPNSSILNISPYIGGDITPPGFVRRIALASNENPFGVSPNAKEIIKNSIDRVRLYPSGNATDLKKAIATHHSINPDWIMVGNGSEDTLHLLAKTYASQGDEIIFAQHAFGLYQIAAHAVGAKAVIAPRENFSLSVQSVLQYVTSKTKLIYLDHPGNPIGTYLSKDALLTLIKKTPSHVLIVIDAAYAEYLEDLSHYTSGIDYVPDYPNVVMARTFSKAYALAGLRLGWIYANPEILDAVNRIRPPFNTSSIAQKAGIAALQDHKWLQKVKNHNAVRRPWFEKEITKLGLDMIPCHANFSMVNFKEKCADVYQYLGRSGIIVRPMGPYDLPSYLRITIGQTHEMEELVELLKKYYGQ
jgi:histidinol-phosphate aminotransferase